jgi:hypothetical protein
MSSRAESAPRSASRWNSHVLRALMQVHPPVTLLVGATPDLCVRTLATAARPSTSRLHHRDLFQEGRRYHIQPRADGFRMITDTRVFWGSRRQRTQSTVILHGHISPAGTDDSMSIVRLSVRTRPFSVLAAFGMPLFVAWILTYMPWGAPVITMLIAAMLGLAWLGTRFNAAFQANEMVYFVRTVLDDLPQARIAALAAAPAADVIVPGAPPAAEFRREWERTYGESPGGDG